MRNSELKKLKFQGVTYYYYSGSYDDGYNYWENTYVYESNDKYKVVPKYPILKFFRISESTKVITNNKLLFKLYIDIQSTDYTKSEVRNKLQQQVDLLHREEEIKNGEII